MKGSFTIDEEEYGNQYYGFRTNELTNLQNKDQKSRAEFTNAALDFGNTV